MYRKNKLGIKSKLVVSERMSGTDIVDPKWSEVRFLPKEFDNPTATLIFGDKVAIIVWTEMPVGFLIERYGDVLKSPMWETRLFRLDP